MSPLAFDYTFNMMKKLNFLGKGPDRFKISYRSRQTAFWLVLMPGLFKF